MDVKFIYWGNQELLERLTEPRHIGACQFYFDIHGFDESWFTARLDEAIKTAGPRYTPEINVELPIAFEFEAFGRTESFFNEVKKHAHKIRHKRIPPLIQDRDATSTPELDAAIKLLDKHIEAVLGGLAGLEFQPHGSLPFKTIIKQVETAQSTTEEIGQLLEEQERAYETKVHEEEKNISSSTQYRNPFMSRRFSVIALQRELRNTNEVLKHVDSVAGSTLMILQGKAGTGKTHLLCDVAKNRIKNNQPTVLLLGQRFISNDAPWFQALQQLDMANLSAEVFIGALEAAAQAAGNRALIMIDAINEGAGRHIWPTHLPAFLALIERSQWIGVVLAVRSSYEEIIVPQEIREKAVPVLHQGFLEHEFDATRTFFLYYELELPSTPLLTPEFQNPLFLKTLCLGLRELGMKRLPRGFQGISAVFEMYLKAVNKKLALSLDFDDRKQLVSQALEVFSKEIVENGDRWLSLETATEIVNALLPAHEFGRSLYRGLVVEGVLVEEAIRNREGVNKEIVLIAYERFADHLVTKNLLDKYFDSVNPATAFAPEGGLSFLADETHFITPGVIEAMWIQVAERSGKELVLLVPVIADRWGIRDAFLQSLVWRATNAFSDDTISVLNNLCGSDRDLGETLEALLTVATIPDHPLNADFLHKHLCRETMPDRDAWWSVFLHNTWGGHGAVDRIINWALMVKPETAIEDKTVDLSSTTLAWMFTTANRFLRDRATKALVCLLSGRTSAAIRLIEKFSDIDDPYVVERVYAVIYGVAMRYHDPVEIGELAEHVYSRIFSTGAPPPHILLRDYARGVVERALYLNSKIHIDVDLIRPPYKSKWPAIPNEEDIQPFLPDYSSGSHDSGDLKWAQNRIGHSILGDDFGHYMIGTNNSTISQHWLSLRIDEPTWKLPERPENLLEVLKVELSKEENIAWEVYFTAENAYQKATPPIIIISKDGREKLKETKIVKKKALERKIEKKKILRITKLRKSAEKALNKLITTLSPKHAEQLRNIFVDRETYYDRRNHPGFDLKIIQRYILKRVFELGWTTERFGYFDRFSIGYQGREAKKPERIGKKYQWIAYHEIMALLSDHFQHRELYNEEEWSQSYDGPWQGYYRDIDPSCTIQSSQGGTTWEGHIPNWWASIRYDDWKTHEDPRKWTNRYYDFPNIPDLLVVTNPVNNTKWVNAKSYLCWQTQPPADKEPSSVERREIWVSFTGYLIRKEDAAPFIKWAKTVDFWGKWMPDPQEMHQVLLGEHGWAPASRYSDKQYYGNSGYIQPDRECPIKVRTVAYEYQSEANGFDCSIDEGFRIRLPMPELINGMHLRWSGNGGDFVGPDGRLTVFDPTIHTTGPDALLIQEEPLRNFLEKEGLTICWAILGEKRVFPPGFDPVRFFPGLQISGAYVIDKGKPVGFINFQQYLSKGNPPPMKIIGEIRHTKEGKIVKRSLNRRR
jgi:hypothetical protein